MNDTQSRLCYIPASSLRTCSSRWFQRRPQIRQHSVSSSVLASRRRVSTYHCGRWNSRHHQTRIIQHPVQISGGGGG